MYNKYLSPVERQQCMKFGAYLKLAEHNVHPDKFMKSAAETSVFSPGYNAMRAVAFLSLLTGIPTGIAAHIIGNKINQSNLKEEELKNKIKYYRNATQGIETGLEASDAEAPVSPIASDAKTQM